jgi:hypothetical protein
MSVPKKSKTYHFHDEWEIKYFFVMVKDKCCLICNASVSLPKKDNLVCHYNALHSNNYDADFQPKSEIPELQLKEWQNQGHLLTIQPYHPSRSAI